MGTFVTKLKQETQMVIDIIGQRTQEMAAIDPKAMQPARQQTEDAYVKLAGIINAHAICEEAGGESPYDACIDTINADIDYYVSKVFNKEKGKDEPEPEPTPEPEPEPEPTPVTPE